MTKTEILSLIVIPLTVVLLPLIWGMTGWMIKRSQFLELIFRELEEIGPYPETKEKEPKEHWIEHHNNKRILHKEIILEKATENRDLILSLPADVVYYVTQLWNFQDNSKQWLYMLGKLESTVPLWRWKRKREIANVRTDWYFLMKEYGEVVDVGVKKTNLLKRIKDRIRIFDRVYPK